LQQNVFFCINYKFIRCYTSKKYKWCKKPFKFVSASLNIYPHPLKIAWIVCDYDEQLLLHCHQHYNTNSMPTMKLPRLQCHCEGNKYPLPTCISILHSSSPPFSSLWWFWKMKFSYQFVCKLVETKIDLSRHIRPLLLCQAWQSCYWC